MALFPHIVCPITYIFRNGSFVSAYVLCFRRSRSSLHRRSSFFRATKTCRFPTFITIGGLIQALEILKTLRCGCTLRFRLLANNHLSLSTGTLPVLWMVPQRTHRLLHLPSGSAPAPTMILMLLKPNTDRTSTVIFRFRLLSRRLSGFIGITAQRRAMSIRIRAGMALFRPENETGYGPRPHTTGQRPSSEVELKCCSSALVR